MGIKMELGREYRLLTDVLGVQMAPAGTIVKPDTQGKGSKDMILGSSGRVLCSISPGVACFVNSDQVEEV